MGAWYGSKATSGLCQPLIAAMPPHATYIETHLGGGAIMQRKPPAQRRSCSCTCKDLAECVGPTTRGTSKMTGK